MSTTHFMITLDGPGDDGPSQDDMLKAIQAAFPSYSPRVRAGFPKVMVVVPEDPEEAVIFSTDARVDAFVVDTRNLDADSLTTARNRLAGDEGLEIGSGTKTFEAERIRAVAVLDAAIEECSAAPGFR